MEHTYIVSALDLEGYAATRESESVIPELIWLLVTQSVQDLQTCRIPYGDAINQPGWDGLIESSSGHRQYVPINRSFWEIGTAGNPQAKATSDFKKRTRALGLHDRSQAAYVFVTPRSAGTNGWTEPSQARWKSKRTDFGWREIRILDGPQVTDWLREFPALGKWLLKKMGSLKVVRDLSTPAEHWEELRQLVSAGDPPLPPKVFLAGRDKAAEALGGLFRKESNLLLLAVESENDAEDFVSAFLASLDPTAQAALGNHCLFIRDADAWMTFANLKTPHVLVAHPRLDIENDVQLQTAARKNSHGIVIPVSGTWSHGATSLVQLRSPSGSLLESILHDSGFSSGRVRELAGAGALSLAALKRHLLGLGELPPYATWENARVLAQANLFGKWDGANKADQSAIEGVLGKAYGEWIEAARAETLRAGAPLIQRAEKWKTVSRGEAWAALGPRITDSDLDKFANFSVAVLGSVDPRFDLPSEDRYLSSVIHTERPSKLLMEGCAESLALLGSKPESLTSCSPGKARDVASLVVRRLLEQSDWKRWCSLNDYMPLLAEASPDEFLSGLDSAVGRRDLFNEIFGQESGGTWSSNYTSGILWALETLAWDPDYLVQATLLLGDLAAIDPGGSWTNRPANSLNHILLPWYPQTTAAIEIRRVAVERLISERPLVAWQLLISLLPRSTGTTSGTRRPSWRPFIPASWKESVSIQEYSQQVELYSDLAFHIAASDVQKLSELVDHLPDLSKPAHLKLMEHLSSPSVLSLSDEDRLQLWESLVDLGSKHKKFAHTQWALPSDAVASIFAVADILAPKSPLLLHQRLFSERDFDLYDSEETDDFEAQHQALEQKRAAAAAEIHRLGGMAGVFAFARTVQSPRKFGYAFGKVADGSSDREILPKMLSTDNQPERSFVETYISSRHALLGWTWADDFLHQAWSPADQVAFLICLPFLPETWRIASTMGSAGASYWAEVSPNPWPLKSAKDLLIAAENLMKAERPHQVLTCIYLLVHMGASFLPDIALNALSMALTQKPERGTSDSHQVIEVIQWLQEHAPNDARLFDIEWSYLPLLDEMSGAEPKTIERLLSNDPSLYVRIVSLVFRSEQDAAVEKRTFSDEERTIAQNAYRLLKTWRRIPGATETGEIVADRFLLWVEKVKELASASGHLSVALSQLGELLAYSPSDPDGLWVARPVAAALDTRDAEPMRRGFGTGLFNLRGVYTVDGGRGERALAAEFRSKAKDLLGAGYGRLSAVVKDVAESYERDAIREQLEAQDD